MINLDRFDLRVIDTLKKGVPLGKVDLRFKSNTKEGQKTFNERINKLDKLGVINVSLIDKRGNGSYLIELNRKVYKD